MCIEIRVYTAIRILLGHRKIKGEGKGGVDFHFLRVRAAPRSRANLALGHEYQRWRASASSAGVRKPRPCRVSDGVPFGYLVRLSIVRVNQYRPTGAFRSSRSSPIANGGTPREGWFKDVSVTVWALTSAPAGTGNRLDPPAGVSL